MLKKILIILFFYFHILPVNSMDFKNWKNDEQATLQLYMCGFVTQYALENMPRDKMNQVLQGLDLDLIDASMEVYNVVQRFKNINQDQVMSMTLQLSENMDQNKVLWAQVLNCGIRYSAAGLTKY